MGRMKIEMPTEWVFETEMDVRITDLNYGNHLANQNFLAIAQEARMRYFKAHDLSELDFGGVSLIQADAAIIFKGEGFYADPLQIKVSAVRSGNSSFNVFYLIINKETAKELAHIRTAMVCFNYDIRKPVAIPEKVLHTGLFAKS